MTIVGRNTLLIVFFISLSISFFSFQGYAQVQFLLMPSNQDLSALSTVFKETGKPVPVHIVYSNYSGGIIMGISLSDKIRQGVHARLLVQTGIVNDLYEVKLRNHSYFAGTLFLEQQEGVPVLSFHGRNSNRSTVNINSNGTASIDIPPKILAKISYLTDLPIVNASEQLDSVIREENERRYLKGKSLIDRVELSEYHSLDKDIILNRKITSPFWREFLYKLKIFQREKNLYSHPDLVQKIINNRVGNSCARLLRGF